MEIFMNKKFDNIKNIYYITSNKKKEKYGKN